MSSERRAALGEMSIGMPFKNRCLKDVSGVVDVGAMRSWVDVLA